VALAMAVNLTRADAATRAMTSVRRTRGEAGVLVTPEALTRYVHFVRGVHPSYLVFLLRLRERLRVGWFSALRNIGPTISRSKHRKAAMLLVLCGLTRL
jgi:hypothetical protein